MDKVTNLFRSSSNKKEDFESLISQVEFRRDDKIFFELLKIIANEKKKINSLITNTYFLNCLRENNDFLKSLITYSIESKNVNTLKLCFAIDFYYNEFNKNSENENKKTENVDFIFKLQTIMFQTSKWKNNTDKGEFDDFLKRIEDYNLILVAAVNGTDDIIIVLKHLNLISSKANENGENMLHIAIKNNNLNFLNYLKKLTATEENVGIAFQNCLKQKSNIGKTPFQLSIKNVDLFKIFFSVQYLEFFENFDKNFIFDCINQNLVEIIYYIVDEFMKENRNTYLSQKHETLANIIFEKEAENGQITNNNFLYKIFLNYSDDITMSICDKLIENDGFRGNEKAPECICIFEYLFFDKNIDNRSCFDQILFDKYNNLLDHFFKKNSYKAFVNKFYAYKDNEDNNSLHLTAKTKNSKLFYLLLTNVKDQDLNRKNKNGETPLDILVQNNDSYLKAVVDYCNSEKKYADVLEKSLEKLCEVNDNYVFFGITKFETFSIKEFKIEVLEKCFRNAVINKSENICSRLLDLIKNTDFKKSFILSVFKRYHLKISESFSYLFEKTILDFNSILNETDGDDNSAFDIVTQNDLDGIGVIKKIYNCYKQENKNNGANVFKINLNEKSFFEILKKIDYDIHELVLNILEFDLGSYNKLKNFDSYFKSSIELKNKEIAKLILNLMSNDANKFDSQIQNAIKENLIYIFKNNYTDILEIILLKFNEQLSALINELINKNVNSLNEKTLVSLLKHILETYKEVFKKDEQSKFSLDISSQTFCNLLKLKDSVLIQEVFNFPGSNSLFEYDTYFDIAIGLNQVELAEVIVKTNYLDKNKIHMDVPNQIEDRLEKIIDKNLIKSFEMNWTEVVKIILKSIYTTNQKNVLKKILIECDEKFKSFLLDFLANDKYDLNYIKEDMIVLNNDYFNKLCKNEDYKAFENILNLYFSDKLNEKYGRLKELFKLSIDNNNEKICKMILNKMFESDNTKSVFIDSILKENLSEIFNKKWFNHVLNPLLDQINEFDISYKIENEYFYLNKLKLLSYILEYYNNKKYLNAFFIKVEQEDFLFELIDIKKFDLVKKIFDFDYLVFLNLSKFLDSSVKENNRELAETVLNYLEHKKNDDKFKNSNEEQMRRIIETNLINIHKHNWQNIFNKLIAYRDILNERLNNLIENDDNPSLWVNHILDFYKENKLEDLKFNNKSIAKLSKTSGNIELVKKLLDSISIENVECFYDVFKFALENNQKDLAKLMFKYCSKIKDEEQTEIIETKLLVVYNKNWFDLLEDVLLNYHDKINKIKFFDKFIKNNILDDMQLKLLKEVLNIYNNYKDKSYMMIIDDQSFCKIIETGDSYLVKHILFSSRNTLKSYSDYFEKAISHKYRIIAEILLNYIKDKEDYSNPNLNSTGVNYHIYHTLNTFLYNIYEYKWESILEFYLKNNHFFNIKINQINTPLDSLLENIYPFGCLKYILDYYSKLREKDEGKTNNYYITLNDSSYIKIIEHGNIDLIRKVDSLNENNFDKPEEMEACLNLAYSKNNENICEYFFRKFIKNTEATSGEDIGKFYEVAHKFMQKIYAKKWSDILNCLLDINEIFKFNKNGEYLLDKLVDDNGIDIKLINHIVEYYTEKNKKLDSETPKKTIQINEKTLCKLIQLGDHCLINKILDFNSSYFLQFDLYLNICVTFDKKHTSEIILDKMIEQKKFLTDQNIIRRFFEKNWLKSIEKVLDSCIIDKEKSLYDFSYLDFEKSCANGVSVNNQKPALNFLYVKDTTIEMEAYPFIDVNPKPEPNYNKEPEKNHDFESDHPLTKIALLGNENLISHSTTRLLLKLKWRYVPRIFYYMNTLLYAIFLITFSVYSLEKKKNFFQASSNSNTSNTSQSSQNLTSPDDTSEDSSVVLAFWFSFILLLYFLITELFQLFMEKHEYFFDLKNLLESSSYALAMVALVLNFFNHDESFNSTNFSLCSISILLGSIILMLRLEKMKKVGIYVLAFRRTLINSLKLFPVSFIVYLGFTIAFKIRSDFKVEHFNGSFSMSLVKPLAMLVGDYPNITELGLENEITSYNAANYIIYVSFILLMSILVFNLFLSIAVGELDSILKVAKNRHVQMRIDYVIKIQKFLYALNSKFLIKGMIIKDYDPEKESRIIKVWKKFVRGLKRLTNEKWDVSSDSSENQSNLLDELNSNLSKEMNCLRNDYEERIRLMEKKIESLSEQLKLVDIESKIDHLENSIKQFSKNTVN